MTCRWLCLFVTCLLAAPARAASDADGCHDHALLPNRIPGYVLSSCDANEFSAATFRLKDGEVEVQGAKTVLIYSLPEGAKAVSSTYVARNYATALEKVGGKVTWRDDGFTGASLQLRKGGAEIWVSVAGYIGEGGPENTGQYVVTIVEKGGLNVVITASDLLAELRAQGRVAIYVQFDTGKATVKPESEPLLVEMGRLLQSEKALQVYVVGHTDTEGALDANLKLSEARAASVVAALVTKHGIAAARLVAKGVGPLSPIATNDSEDGRKRNRRVELVKR